MVKAQLREVPVSALQPAETYFRHPHALVESAQVGAGTRVWAFAHVMDGAIVGAGCNLGDHSFVESGARLGDRVTLKNGVSVWRGVSIEEDAFIGPGVTFTNDPQPRAFIHRPPGQLLKTVIRRGATLGAQATILCGLEVGAFAFVAAAAVVTRNVPDHALMIGVPARQQGWVCDCAFRLEQQIHGQFLCSSCQRWYSLENGRIRSLPPARS